MANVIDQLRSEHTDIARILDIFEDELGKIETGSAPDYALIRNIADYFLDFPDTCHHPKEDVLYRSLIATRPVSLGPVVDIEAEHKVVGKIAREFAIGIRCTEPETDTLHASLVELAQRFIKIQRRHLQTEEARLFPMALDTLSEDDFAAIDARIVSATDPVFGNIPEARYELLCEKILSWDGEESDGDPADFKSALA